MTYHIRQSKAVSIIVLNWNNHVLTNNCLRSIEELDYGNYNIIMVDNGSVDGSVEYLGKRHPNITILETGQNLGFAGGVNVGIRYALAQEADFIWILNNDTLITPNSLTGMVSIANRDSTIGAVGSVLIEKDASHNVLVWGGGRINFISGLVSHYGTVTRPEKIHYLKGACILLRSAAIREIGSFDESYFLYWEDADLCFRLRSAGWKLYVAKDALVYHDGYGSSEFVSPQWDYYFTLSSIVFFRRHARFAFLPIIISAGGRIVCRALKRKWANVAAVLAALGYKSPLFLASSRQIDSGCRD